MEQMEYEHLLNTQKTEASTEFEDRRRMKIVYRKDASEDTNLIHKCANVYVQGRITHDTNNQFYEISFIVYENGIITGMASYVKLTLIYDTSSWKSPK